MDPVAGGLGACLVSMLGITTGKLAMTEGLLVGGVPAWQVALGIWTSAWVLQFIGHGIFESEGTY